VVLAVLLSLLLAAPAAATPPAAAAAKSPAAAPAKPAPGFKSFTRRPPVLPEAEYETLKKRVMERCNVSPGIAPGQAPWYYHYELGLELAKKGDPQRALDALIEAVDKKPEPQRNARLYGMWFKDYLPYFEIARVHASLGNWECVDDAVTLSQKTLEVGSGDKEQRDLLDLRSEAQAHLHPVKKKP